MRGRSALATAALVFVLAAAGRAALGPVYGGRVTVALGELPARFEPAPAQGAGARLIAALVHERLVDLGDLVPKPALAQSWKEAASGREWTLRLRAGAVFHDGTTVGSAEVVRSLRRFLRSPSAAAQGLAARLEGGAAYRNKTTEDLPGLAAGDPLTVILRLREPSAATLSYLAAPAAAITSARGAGAGPFVPTTASPIRGRAAFVPFGGHVRGRPFLDGLTLRAADSGEGPADVTPAVGTGRLVASLLLFLDPAHPAFSRVESRRDVAAAIDRDDLVRNFLSGGTTTTSPIPALLLPGLPEAGHAARRRPVAGSIVLAVSSDVPAVVSQRVVAYLGAAGLKAAAVEAAPDAVWTTPAAARLVAWTPEVPDALLALEELTGLVGQPGRETLARAALESEPDRREALLHKAEAALRSRVDRGPAGRPPSRLPRPARGARHRGGRGRAHPSRGCLGRPVTRHGGAARRHHPASTAHRVRRGRLSARAAARRARPHPPARAASKRRRTRGSGTASRPSRVVSRAWKARRARRSWRWRGRTFPSPRTPTCRASPPSPGSGGISPSSRSWAPMERSFRRCTGRWGSACASRTGCSAGAKQFRVEKVSEGYGAEERLVLVAERPASLRGQAVIVRGGSFIDGELLDELSRLMGAEVAVRDEARPPLDRRRRVPAGHVGGTRRPEWTRGEVVAARRVLPVARPGAGAGALAGGRHPALRDRRGHGRGRSIDPHRGHRRPGRRAARGVARCPRASRPRCARGSTAWPRSWRASRERAAPGRARGGVARDGAAARPRAEEPDLPHPALDRDPAPASPRTTPSGRRFADLFRESSLTHPRRAARAAEDHRRVQRLRPHAARRSLRPLDVERGRGAGAAPVPRRARAGSR